MNERFLWSFYWECGRSGSVEGLFVATEEEIEQAIGQHINFGEILGKHSEVYGTLEMKNLTKLELDTETVEKVITLLGTTWSGYNPLDYIKCTECNERAIELGGIETFVDGVCTYCVEEMKVNEHCIIAMEEDQE